MGSSFHLIWFCIAAGSAVLTAFFNFPWVQVQMFYLNMSQLISDIYSSNINMLERYFCGLQQSVSPKEHALCTAHRSYIRGNEDSTYVMFSFLHLLLCQHYCYTVYPLICQQVKQLYGFRYCRTYYSVLQSISEKKNTELFAVWGFEPCHRRGDL